MGKIYKNLPVNAPASLERKHATPPSVVESPPSSSGQKAPGGLSLNEASSVAHEELARMRQELAVLREQAKKEGFQRGYDEGQTTAKAQHAQLQTRLTHVLAELNQRITQAVAEQEPLLVELAMIAIARLTGEQLSRRQGAIAIVKQTLAEYREKQLICVHLSSEDYAHLSTNIELADLNPAVHIVASPKVTLGGCLIETANGFIDARVETQLARMRDVLLHACKAAREQD